MAWWRKVDLYWIWDGTPRRARAMLEKMPKQVDVETTRLWILQEIYERDWQAALNRVQACPWDWLADVPKSYYEYRCLVRLGKPQAARTAVERAREAWETALRERPSDPALHSGLGLAYAALGRKEEAIKEGEAALALRNPETNPYLGPYDLAALARILALVGEQERAMDQIDKLLAMPSCFTPGLLRLDPDWERLNGNPRFEKAKVAPGSAA
jgi:tetratricopeptide (TPR) repeat protein